VALTINDIYVLVQDLANKYKQGYLSPDQFNEFFNMAQRELFDDLIGPPESWQYGKPVPRAGALSGKTIEEMLSPFLTPYVANINSSGQVIKPADFEREVSFNSSTNLLVFRRIQLNRLNTALNDPIDVVSSSRPIYTDSGGFYQVYPSINWVNFSTTLMYYKTPPQAVWGYNTDSDGLPVYKPLTSINQVWRDQEINDLVQRTLMYFGINLANPQITTYADEQKTKGE
jgi:hypothetical protein